MSPTRLISAVSAVALMGALAAPALAQAPQPKTEAAAKAQTGNNHQTRNAMHQAQARKDHAKPVEPVANPGKRETHARPCM